MVSREFGFNSSIKVSVNMFATSEVLGKWKLMWNQIYYEQGCTVIESIFSKVVRFFLSLDLMKSCNDPLVPSSGATSAWYCLQSLVYITSATKFSDASQDHQVAYKLNV